VNIVRGVVGVSAAFIVTRNISVMSCSSPNMVGRKGSMPDLVCLQKVCTEPLAICLAIGNN